MQALAYLIVFTARGRSAPALSARGWAGLALGVAGAALMVMARGYLGRQWAIQARLIEGHRLVTSGPYAVVRNPIYTGMLAVLLGAGLALATLPRTAAAVGVFLAGTALRTQREERLLRAAFGGEFEAYRRRAGWLWPRLRPWRGPPARTGTGL